MLMMIKPPISLTVTLSLSENDDDDDRNDDDDDNDKTSDLPDSHPFLNLSNDPTDCHNVAT